MLHLAAQARFCGPAWLSFWCLQTSGAKTGGVHGWCEEVFDRDLVEGPSLACSPFPCLFPKLLEALVQGVVRVVRFLLFHFVSFCFLLFPFGLFVCSFARLLFRSFASFLLSFTIT